LYILDTDRCKLAQVTFTWSFSLVTPFDSLRHFLPVVNCGYIAVLYSFREVSCCTSDWKLIVQFIIEQVVTCVSETQCVL